MIQMSASTEEHPCISERREGKEEENSDDRVVSGQAFMPFQLWIARIDWGSAGLAHVSRAVTAPRSVVEQPDGRSRNLHCAALR